MSSFVIAKEEYIKAAGIVAGFASIYREFWVYDYKNHRNMTTEDYYNNFVTCYTMNAKSVAEQYGDKKPETDNKKYLATFKEYQAVAKKAWYAYKVNDITLALRDFFRSALYQTEGEKYSTCMEMFFSRIIDQLLDHANPRETECWGSLELDNIFATN